MLSNWSLWCLLLEEGCSKSSLPLLVTLFSQPSATAAAEMGELRSLDQLTDAGEVNTNLFPVTPKPKEPDKELIGLKEVSSFWQVFSQGV
jgi:hypothetical protein